MYPLVQVLVRALFATCGANLGGLHGIDFGNDTASPCCLARDDLHKLSPSCIQHTLIQATFCSGSIWQVHPVFILFGFGTAYQVRELQLFKDDHLVLFDEFVGLLVVKVSSLVSYLAMCFRYDLTRLFPPMGTAFLARQSMLLALQVSLRLAKEAG